MNADVLSVLRELIARKPVTGGEDAALQYAASFLNAAGFTVRMEALGDGRHNVVAEKGSGGKTLIWIGHADVVPAGDEAMWTSDPFRMAERDGMVYGRGSCDMLGAVACLLVAAKDFSPSKGTLRVLIDADEESTNAGMLAYMRSAKKADFAVVGEPTELRVATRHRGVTHIEVTLAGQKAHASKARQALNPISFAARAIPLLEEFACVTMARAGDSKNTVPGTCVLTLDIRLMPGQTQEGAMKSVRKCLDAAAEGKKGFSYSARFLSYSPPYAADDKHPFCEKARSVTQAATGIGQAKEAWFGATCEAGYAASFVEGPVVILGPGDIEKAHAVDECVPVRQLDQGAKAYRALFEEMV